MSWHQIRSDSDQTGRGTTRKGVRDHFGLAENENYDRPCFIYLPVQGAIEHQVQENPLIEWCTDRLRLDLANSRSIILLNFIYTELYSQTRIRGIVTFIHCFNVHRITIPHFNPTCFLIPPFSSFPGSSILEPNLYAHI